MAFVASSLLRLVADSFRVSSSLGQLKGELTSEGFMMPAPTWPPRGLLVSMMRSHNIKDPRQRAWEYAQEAMMHGIGGRQHGRRRGPTMTRTRMHMRIDRQCVVCQRAQRLNSGGLHNMNPVVAAARAAVFGLWRRLNPFRPAASAATQRHSWHAAVASMARIRLGRLLA
uniref:Uncharacterized protein n=1 Tax=Leersia perrieri TaxID=77586 RepID=A0A0D9X6H6_9ORYZ